MNTHEPYFKFLGKWLLTVFATYNVLALCIIGPFIGLVFVGLVFGAAFGSTTASQPEHTYSTIYGSGYNQLLSIKINGVVTGTQATDNSIFGSLDGQTAGYTVKQSLYDAADDDTIKGIILEIDSPGGTIYGAHAIADGVAYYRQTTHKPVYAHISGTGASGAYWAAASTDKILADYGSDVGSIGVIMGPFQYYNTPVAEDGGLLAGGIVTQNGIESTYITAGRSKDVGNPYRRLTTDEVASLQKQVNNEYTNFVSFVSQRRGIPAATITSTIGAMAYDPQTALELKLTDGTTDRQTAYAELAKAAKVSDDYQVVQDDASYGFLASLLQATNLKPKPAVQKADLCSLSQTSLAYHGDVTAWCK